MRGRTYNLNYYGIQTLKIGWLGFNLKKDKQFK